MDREENLPLWGATLRNFIAGHKLYEPIRQCQQSPQAIPGSIDTWSPTLNDLTFAPISTISPALS